MTELGTIGKASLILGVFLIVFGLLLTTGSKIPFLGKLPGDFAIEREHVKIFFPLTSSLLISTVLTVILYLVWRISGR